ncbi:MAG: hypothetical protein R2722_04705 [Tessaracoccus sp.]
MLCSLEKKRSSFDLGRRENVDGSASQVAVLEVGVEGLQIDDVPPGRG